MAQFNSDGTVNRSGDSEIAKAIARYREQLARDAADQERAYRERDAENGGYAAPQAQPAPQPQYNGDWQNVDGQIVSNQPNNIRPRAQAQPAPQAQPLQQAFAPVYQPPQPQVVQVQPPAIPNADTGIVDQPAQSSQAVVQPQSVGGLDYSSYDYNPHDIPQGTVKDGLTDMLDMLITAT